MSCPLTLLAELVVTFYTLSHALPATGRRRVASEPRRHPDRLRLLPQRPARLEGHAPSPPLRPVTVVMASSSLHQRQLLHQPPWFPARLSVQARCYHSNSTLWAGTRTAGTSRRLFTSFAARQGGAGRSDEDIEAALLAMLAPEPPPGARAAPGPGNFTFVVATGADEFYFDALRNLVGSLRVHGLGPGAPPLQARRPPPPAVPVPTTLPHMLID